MENSWDVLKDIQHGRNYSCPLCKKNPPDDNTIENGYLIDGKKYPIYLNERKGGTMDGSYHDWEEIHKCKKCKIEFRYTNGCY